MSSFKSFPKIGQYRNALKELAAIQGETGQSKFKFTGTIKLHGTNAAIGYCSKTDSIYCQSRNRIITADDDNAGFASWVSERQEQFKEFMLKNFNGESALVFGEWCGGNIQKGVALQQLPKMFVIFNSFHREQWQSSLFLSDEQDIDWLEFIDSFPTYSILVDLSNPEGSIEELTSITQTVEAECPVGKAFGVSGTGEGVVWTCTTDNSIRFKVKGEKHSATKVKKLVSVDPEKLASIDKFVEYAVTENRLKQGLEVVGSDISQTGNFIGWVNKDIWSEEKDTLDSSNLSMKDVAKSISRKARAFFLEQAA